MSETPQKSGLAKGLIFVGGATLIGNGAAYALSMVSARVLDQADFGALGSLLALLVIVATLGISTQALTARRVAAADPADRPSVEGQAIRLAVMIGAAILIGGVIMAWPLGAIFTIPVVAVATGIGSLAFVVVGSASMGIAQGRQENTRLAWAFIANGASRAIGGIVGVVVLQSVTGVGIGVFIGCAIGAVISYQLVCPRTWGTQLNDGIGVEFGHIAHALIVLFTLTNIDILLARIFLSEELSGEYAVGVLLAKIAFFLPNAIIIVLFPRMAAGDSRRAVYIATALTATLGLFMTLGSLLLGDFVVRILGGAQYVALGLGSQAYLFALEGSAFALVQVLLYSRLAAQDRKAVALVWVALLVLVVIVVFFRHDSVEQIVTTVVGVSLVLTVVGLLMDRRSVPKSPTVPIEAAE